MATQNQHDWLFHGKIQTMLTFIAKFTDKTLSFIKLGSRYFLEDKALAQHKLDGKEKYIGLFLGEDVNEVFVPSFNLLSWLAENSKEKVFLKDIGEIDFLYGKNLRARQVDHIEGETKVGYLKLVQNMHDENLGYGKVCGDLSKTQQVIKHRRDLGDFLKREKALNKS